MNYKRLFLENSYIFITIVTFNRQPILINNIEKLIIAYKKVSELYSFELIAYSIQNDHIHCIIKPNNINEYPKIIKSFKYAVTKNVGLVKPTYASNDFTKNEHTHNKIWQNRYWEHTIRDEEDLNKHLDYIHYNCVKHGLAENVKDWKYSSFQKFFEQNMYDINWGSAKDIEKIANLDYE